MIPSGIAERSTAPGAIDRTRTRFLTPDTCRIRLGTLGALHVKILDEADYGGIYAAYTFPVGCPDGYVSLIYTGGERDVEVGIIRDLKEFPEAEAVLVREALRRRYFIHRVLRIREISVRYTLLHFRVDTDKGSVGFFMRWSQDRAFEYGERGKVLIDLNDNRYLVPNVEELPTHERVQFQRYIYW